VPAAPHAVHAVPFGAVDESGAVYESREVADHVRTGAVPVGGDADDAFAPPGGETGGGEDVIECVPWLAEPDATVTPSQELKGVRYLFWHGRTDEGLAALARYEAGHPDGPGDSAELRTWLRYWYPGLAVPDAPADGGPEAGSPGAAEGPYAPETDGMAALAALLDGLPAADAVRRAERVLRESRLGRVPVRSITAALTVLLYADQADRAARWCAGAVSRAEHTWDPAGDALLATLTAESALRQGDLRTAEEYARTAFQRIRPGSWGVGVGFPLATMIEARTALGRHEDAARYAALRVPEAMFDTPAGLHYRHARGRHRLAVGATEQALADFRACGETMARWDVDHLPGLVPWRIGAARAQLALGRPREARALADQQLARLDPGPSRVRGMALRTRAAAGEPAERTALLQHAARALEESGDRYELSAALTDLSAAHGEQGDPARARTVERRARHLSRITGTESAATEDDLSEAERRVAELAARGLTNREIARKLYITVSTVEQHLTRVYRKLGVQRRMELRYSLDSQRGLAG
jgi:DNA-binding CsgD family transcriptional regulator